MKLNKNKGISLIVLVITIIVIIILAGAIIINLINNNSALKAKEAAFKTNIDTYKSELLLVISNKYVEKSTFDPTTFNKGVWNGGEVGETIKKYITTITEADGKIFEIQKGKLVYVGNDETEKTWSVDSGIEIATKLDSIPPTVTYGTNGGSGDIASTTVTVTDEGGSNLNESTLQYVWDTQNVNEPTSGWLNFTNGETLTKGSVNGTYYLWIKASDNMGNLVASKTNAFNLSLEYNASKGVNRPKLYTGMTPVKWNGSSWDVVSDPSNDTSWYDYTNKQWANAKTADGSMWVWIPRYEYKISTPHTSTTQSVLINFLDTTSAAVTSGYIVHPAFTFGAVELTGIWVGKFEASGSISAVGIKPNASALRGLSMNSIFTACRNMETTYGNTYGWGTSGVGIDTHLIKNIEWGSVAYLTHSKYGKNSEVWTNPNKNYTTGQAGTSVSPGGITTTYAYNTTYGVNASTTGNVYGIYDMSGGADEYTAAYVNNGNAELTNDGLSLVNAASQYKDVYTSSGDSQTGNYSAASSKKGDAVYETSYQGNETGSAWNGDMASMPYGTYPFIVRGGNYADLASGGIFEFKKMFGHGDSDYFYFGFRPVVIFSNSL